MPFKSNPSPANAYSRRGNRPLALAVAAACGAVGVAGVTLPGVAQAQIEEVVVTATRRAESIQDIPMSVSVLGEAQLTDLNITDMEDYLMMLPNVGFISLGPSTGSIYIRGISSGGESLLGANPAVAVYLDEQPVT
ncbi:MAG: TonB-dependent receptor plug domain-containing protein, partial [Luminiphilus sp.]